MSYSKNKSKYTKLPFEISKANGINDNFTIQFKPKSATMFRASDEYTKYIDDDYSKFLHASVINGNAAASFNLRTAETQTEEPWESNQQPVRRTSQAETQTEARRTSQAETQTEARRTSQAEAQTEAVRTSQAEAQTDAQRTPQFFNLYEYDEPDLEPVLIDQQNTEERRAKRMREIGQDISSSSGDMIVDLIPLPEQPPQTTQSSSSSSALPKNIKRNLKNPKEKRKEAIKQDKLKGIKEEQSRIAKLEKQTAKLLAAEQQPTEAGASSSNQPSAEEASRKKAKDFLQNIYSKSINKVDESNRTAVRSVLQNAYSKSKDKIKKLESKDRGATFDVPKAKKVDIEDNRKIAKAVLQNAYSKSKDKIKKLESKDRGATFDVPNPNDDEPSPQQSTKKTKTYC